MDLSSISPHKIALLVKFVALKLHYKRAPIWLVLKFSGLNGVIISAT